MAKINLIGAGEAADFKEQVQKAILAGFESEDDLIEALLCTVTSSPLNALAAEGSPLQGAMTRLYFNRQFSLLRVALPMIVADLNEMTLFPKEYAHFLVAVLLYTRAGVGAAAAEGGYLGDIMCDEGEFRGDPSITPRDPNMKPVCFKTDMSGIAHGF